MKNKYFRFKQYAGVVEQVYTQDLKSCDLGHEGSNPSACTICRGKDNIDNRPLSKSVVPRCKS